MKLSPGEYTFREVLEKADFDIEKEALTEYESSGQHVDHRRVQVGGLSFDDLDDRFRVPESADNLSITLDGKEVSKFSVE